MPDGKASARQPSSIGNFVRTSLQQYRSQLLDLSSRNPLISFRHSERSRSHIRIVDEIPEILFSKLEAGKQLTFIAVPEPVLVPPDEQNPMFQSALREMKRNDQEYAKQLTELGPSPSDR